MFLFLVPSGYNCLVEIKRCGFGRGVTLSQTLRLLETDAVPIVPLPHAYQSKCDVSTVLSTMSLL